MASLANKLWSFLTKHILNVFDYMYTYGTHTTDFSSYQILKLNSNSAIEIVTGIMSVLTLNV